MNCSRSNEDCSKAPAGSFRELMLIAIPLIIGFGSQSLMNFIDRIFLTWHSSTALAASMPAGMLNWTFLSFAYGIANYTSTFVSQYEGAKRPDRVASVIWQAAAMALFFGAILAVLSLFSPAIFAFMGHSEDVQRAEVSYFSTLCAGCPALLLLTALSGFFSGKGHTAVVMCVNLVAVIVNLILDYLLIFGVAGFPALGIWGAGLATVSGNIVASILFALLIVIYSRRENYPMGQERKLDFELCARIIKYGLPMGLQLFVDVAGFAIFALFVGRIGEAELAATNLAFNLNSLSFIPMVGLGVAVMTLVGRRVGEGNPELAEKTVHHALLLGLSYMGAWCVAYLFAPSYLLTPFAAYAEGVDFASLEKITVILLRFVAVYGLFDVLAIVYGYATRGAGDTLFPLLLLISSSLLCLVIPSALIYFFWQGNLYATWVAVTGYVVVVGTGMFWRFKGGKWKLMSVIKE